MVNNYFTLKALVDEIRGEVAASIVDASFTRVEHTLELVLRKNEEQSKVLVISCKPRANFFFLRRAPKRHTGANVLRDVVGRTILRIGVLTNERTIVFGLSGEKSLVLNLFGPHANVYLVDAAGKLEEAFLGKSKREFNFVNYSAKPLWQGSAGDFTAAFENGTGNPLQKLAGLIPPFSGELGKEAFYRVGGEELLKGASSKATGISYDTALSLFEAVTEMLDELSRPVPRIYYDGDQPVTMGLIELHHLSRLRDERYDSVNLCVATYSANAERHEGDVRLREGLTGKLSGRKDELLKTIGKIETDISGNREAKYRMFADIIMAHLAEVQKGADSFVDASTGEMIRLEPGLSGVQNAQVYYEKAKKARESYRQALARKEELKKELDKVEAELRNVETSKDLDRIAAMSKKEKSREEARTPFREFETNGYVIYVGKDAKNNDELTFGFAKPNDVFLHARGVSGSHVIIRNGSREYPQKAVLEFAARIAAHYSKARTSGIVPVAYTMRKFVKKAKGQPGAVFMDREEVIFVKPGIPL